MAQNIVSLAAARHQRQAMVVVNMISSLQEKIATLALGIEMQLGEISRLIELVVDEDAASKLIKQRDYLAQALEDAKAVAQDRIETIRTSSTEVDLDPD